MKIEKYLQVIETLKSIISLSKFENHCYAVGGCCRDFLLGREIKDIDLVLDIPNGGIEFAKWLFEKGYLTREPVIYEHFGTAMFHLKLIPDIELEAVQTRKEAYRDSDTRNPETTFGTIDDDCTRRDFTYNAIYYNISKGEFNDFNGNSVKDLHDNVIRTCGEPDIIFSEDPLRIFRAIRFQCRYDSVIEEKTFEGMKKNVNRLSIISKERIQEEFNKMMTSGNADLAMKYIIEIGALEFIFNGEEWRKKIDAESCVIAQKELKHLKSVDDADYHNLEVNLAIVYSNLYNVKKRMKYLKYSNDIIEKVLFYIDLDAMIIATDDKPRDIRKLQYKAKTFDNLFNACTIAMANFPDYDEVNKIVKIINSTKEMIKDGTAMFGYNLPVNGEDIMEIKNIEPSQKIKEYMNLLLDIAFTNPLITKIDCKTILNCN